MTQGRKQALSYRAPLKFLQSWKSHLRKVEFHQPSRLTQLLDCYSANLLDWLKIFFK